MIGVSAIDDVSRVAKLVFANHPTSAGEVLDILASAGALLEGHFVLQGGEHSDFFLRFARLTRDEGLAERVATLLLDVAPFVPAREFTVLCPETAGAFLGSAIARVRGAGLAIAEVDDRRCPVPRLRAGEIKPGMTVLVVNDVVTTGNSVSTLIDLAHSRSATVAGVAVFAAIHPEALQTLALKRRLGHAALVHARWPTHAKRAACPGCTRASVALPASELN